MPPSILDQYGSPIQPPSTVSKAVDPYTDSSGGWPIPTMNSGMLFRDVGSYGLRQYGGWVREEFLRALIGREAQRVYREMGDNSPVVGAILFAILQLMRKVDWREDAADDTPAAREAADFARSLRYDMSTPWDDHVIEALTMLQYGFAPCEIVYKRRSGPGRSNPALRTNDASSKFNDGKIGVRRLPIRGQETILKWYFDANGQVLGLQQQPWVGALIDLPIEKFLLFRPIMHKSNPEGRSILRTAYRPWYLMKRFEELEAILYERMSGLPIVRVPNALLLAAKNNDADAAATLDMYQKLAKNVRIDEQMGIVMPSDTYKDAAGSPTAHKMYDFELKTPDTSGLRLDSDKVIRRYEVGIMKSVLADFIDLGHQARGTQNLAISKVDMFYSAIEGWFASMAAVYNQYLLPRVWALNGDDQDLLPHYQADLAQRIDIDMLGKFILAIAQAGMQLFPDRDLENYIRGAAGMPYISEEEEYDPGDTTGEDAERRIAANDERPIGAKPVPNPADANRRPTNVSGNLPRGNGASDVTTLKALDVIGPADAASHLLGMAALKARRSRIAAGRPYEIVGPKKKRRNRPTGVDVHRAALAADVDPSPARRAAGNYPKGHVNFHGLNFSIENAAGSVRRGTASDGTPWASVLPVPYGYVRRTTGADGDQLDVYFGPDPTSTVVFVIDQLDADTGEFDEHKAFVGFGSIGEALDAYHRAFSDGRGDARTGAVHRVSIDGLKAWARGGPLTRPIGALVGKVERTNGHVRA